MPQALFSLDLPANLHTNTPRHISSEIKDKLKLSSARLNQAFWQNADIQDLLYTRSLWFDQILVFAFNYLKLNSDEVALIAVGGYGLHRLHPFSDADIFILIQEHTKTEEIEKLIAFCWDCGLTLGASVRTQDECFHMAKEDLSIFSNLLSMRPIIGNPEFYQHFAQQFSANVLWSDRDFFYAKMAEKERRYARFLETEFNLEPNIKESPGGLRDIDFIIWYALKKFHSSKWHILVKEKLLENNETNFLHEAQCFLWRLRYALHIISGRANEKMYFDYQADLTKQYNIKASSLNQAISLLMKPYYQTATKVRYISELFIQQIAQRFDTSNMQTNVLNENCEDAQGYLNITQNTPLEPENVIALFYLVAKHQLKGINAKSTKLLHAQLEKTPHEAFHTTICLQRFYEILSLKNNVASTLLLMHKLGILIRLIPEFEGISGQMQYDLTHLYTVDAHSLRLIHYLEIFWQQDHFDKIEYLAQCKQQITSFNLLYLCAIFHDIGKGQGGNHAHIGSLLLATFCQQLSLSSKDIELATWLVDKHLLMSLTAQQKDFSDENVLSLFVGELKNEQRLSYIYLFTVADMLATNPAIWNQWRASLLQELYLASLRWMREVPQSVTKAQRNKQDAFAILQQLNDLSEVKTIENLWQNFNDTYFKTETSANIAWHTTKILSHTEPFTVALRPHHSQSGINLFVYAPNRSNLFAALSACLEKNMLTIAQARISHCQNEYTLQSFVALEIAQDAIMSEQRLNQIEATLIELLSPLGDGGNCVVPHVSRHIPRSHQFGFETKVNILNTNDSDKTVIEVRSPDFPGLLARIGEVFMKHEINVHSAIINTLAGQVEDIFYITDKNSGLALVDIHRIAELKSGIETVIASRLR